MCWSMEKYSIKLLIMFLNFFSFLKETYIHCSYFCLSILAQFHLLENITSQVVPSTFYNYSKILLSVLLFHYYYFHKQMLIMLMWELYDALLIFRLAFSLTTNFMKIIIQNALNWLILSNLKLLIYLLKINCKKSMKTYINHFAISVSNSFSCL